MTSVLREMGHEFVQKPCDICSVMDEVPDFSLVLGGPIFQLLRRTRLSGDALQLLYRRVLVITVLAWVPLLLLSIFAYHAPGILKLSFAHDIEVHVRLLIALPVLISAELLVHSRLRVIVKEFLSRRIVLQQDASKFAAAINSANRLRNSVPLEMGLLLLVFTLGQWIWRSQVLSGAVTWYATPQNGHLQLTMAGYWYAFVSVPIFQFILLRWYLRLVIWSRLLWQISRLNLHLIATHPDRAAGLAFLGRSVYALSPIPFAQGAVLSGLIASRVLYEGKNLLSFKMEAISLIVFLLVIVLGPLTVFTPQLGRAKRQGLIDYGALANRYVEEFENKWVSGLDNEGQLLGTGDIQSLADLGNSYAVVREMRRVPFDLQDVGRLAAVTAAPLLPLAFLIFSPEELVLRIVKLVF